MGEVTKVDTHIEATVDPKLQPSADAAAKMAAQAKVGVTKVEATNTPDPKAERPAWLPEKFKTAEEFAKSYTELEKKMGSKAQTTPVVASTDATKATGLDALKVPDKAAATDATKALAESGLKMDEFQAEFTKEGKLGDESYSKLEKAGIPKSMVDSYIAGQQAIMEKTMNDIHSVAGGAEKFQAMHEWSTTANALTDAERSAVNSALESNDVAQIKLAFQAVHAKWIGEVGKEPGVQLRGSKSGDRGDVYTSRDAIQKDMSNPEYQTNESFRRGVAAKIKRSGI